MMIVCMCVWLCVSMCLFVLYYMRVEATRWHQDEFTKAMECVF